SKFGKILEALDRFDQREIAARHHAQRAVFEVEGRARHSVRAVSRFRTRRARRGAPYPLPKIPPDRYQQNAQPPGRTAAGEKYLSAILQRTHDGFLDRLRPARLRKFAIFRN